MRRTFTALDDLLPTFLIVSFCPQNMAQGFCVLMALIIGMPVPLSPIQVLTVNMVR